MEKQDSKPKKESLVIFVQKEDKSEQTKPGPLT